MGKKAVEIEGSGPLRAYRPPWKGELVLVCRKCQKRVKGRKHAQVLSNVRRWFKSRAKGEENAPALRILEIPCVKLCPRGAVTLFSQTQLATDPPSVSIARSEKDLERFYQSLLPQDDDTGQEDMPEDDVFTDEDQHPDEDDAS